jgi:hypothetical protein
MLINRFLLSLHFFLAAVASQHRARRTWTVSEDTVDIGLTDRNAPAAIDGAQASISADAIPGVAQRSLIVKRAILDPLTSPMVYFLKHLTLRPDIVQAFKKKLYQYYGQPEGESLNLWALCIVDEVSFQSRILKKTPLTSEI